ncbi:hypothetical protein Agub_g8905 [Astrephomene gubernaculifera]|uniref:VOC domain-containing protein n=1 Tax=Astrephomene gubernaculifera TaxID=47775 RepID=A0AAD3DUC6_9CHLO|nr:hypothetical protein Agub_g8905 [Astrephomene gubernaculifera]
MLDHVMFKVINYEESKKFYEAALKPLGAKVIKEVPEAKACGFGTCCPDFWITEGPAPTSCHVGFRAASRARVREFHAAALRAGGKDNGAPGLRPQYHPYYYGAFVLDPNGHNIEAVSHMPEGFEWVKLPLGLIGGFFGRFRRGKNTKEE